MIDVQSLTIRYSDRTIVSNFSLEVQEGEIVSIIGPNGSGKSTILKGLSRSIPCESGRICIANHEISSLSNKQVSRIMCMLCQSNTCPLDMTVKELVGYGRVPHKKWYERFDSSDEEVIQWALEQTGLLPYGDRLIVSLSGGEAQRAWIAMALAQRPKVLLLDEPTTYLDIAHQLEVLELISRLNRKLNLTVVMVLHDLNHAGAYSDKIAVIKSGVMREYGPPQKVLTPRLIREVYGVESEVEYVLGSTAPRIHIIKKSRGITHEAIG